MEILRLMAFFFQVIWQLLTSYLHVASCIFSTTRGLELHPQRVGHADAAHCCLCWIGGVLHLQVQKVCMNSANYQSWMVWHWTRNSPAIGPVRKIPWIHVQTEDSHEKEPEVISTVGPNDIMSKVKHSEFSSPKELMEKELEARSRGTQGRFNNHTH